MKSSSEHDNRLNFPASATAGPVANNGKDFDAVFGTRQSKSSYIKTRSTLHFETPGQALKRITSKETHIDIPSSRRGAYSRGGSHKIF